MLKHTFSRLYHLPLASPSSNRAGLFFLDCLWAPWRSAQLGCINSTRAMLGGSPPHETYCSGCTLFYILYFWHIITASKLQYFRSTIEATFTNFWKSCICRQATWVRNRSCNPYWKHFACISLVTIRCRVHIPNPMNLATYCSTVIPPWTKLAKSFDFCCLTIVGKYRLSNSFPLK